MPTTTVTDQIWKLAEQAGLHPAWQEPYGSTRTIALMGDGVATPFGSITVGLRSGKVLRATIVSANDGPARRYTGARAVQAALKELAQTDNTGQDAAGKDGFEAYQARVLADVGPKVFITINEFAQPDDTGQADHDLLTAQIAQAERLIDLTAEHGPIEAARIVFGGER